MDHFHPETDDPLDDRKRKSREAGMNAGAKCKDIRVSASMRTSSNHTNADSPPCCKQIDPSAASSSDSQKWVHILFLFRNFLLTSLARFGGIRVRVT